MTPMLNGLPVYRSGYVPTFVPKLNLQPCGCSDKVLSEFNTWLIERFGQKRQFLLVNGALFVSEQNFIWLKQNARHWTFGEMPK